MEETHRLVEETRIKTSKVATLNPLEEQDMPIQARNKLKYTNVFPIRNFKQ